MKFAMIIGLVGSILTHNVGVAENEHYINFADGTGYYVEDEELIHIGDIVLEVNDELFVVCKKQLTQQVEFHPLDTNSTKIKIPLK